MKKIGLITIATGKYDCFIPGLFNSFKQHFITNCNSDLIVLTDSEKINNEDRLFVYKVPHTNWPMSTLLRFKYFTQNKDFLEEYDYLYFIDCDMVFNENISEEILPNNEFKYVGTIHPGFYTDMKNATFENNPECKAFIPKEKQNTYYQACFFGALKDEFLSMSQHLNDNIDLDLSKNIIALWHDESHLNAYFAYRNVLKIHPGYAYPELLNIPFQKKIIHLSKNHSEIRNK